MENRIETTEGAQTCLPDGLPLKWEEGWLLPDCDYTSVHYGQMKLVDLKDGRRLLTRKGDSKVLVQGPGDRIWFGHQQIKQEGNKFSAITHMNNNNEITLAGRRVRPGGADHPGFWVPVAEERARNPVLAFTDERHFEFPDGTTWRQKLGKAKMLVLLNGKTWKVDLPPIPLTPWEELIAAAPDGPPDAPTRVGAKLTDEQIAESTALTQATTAFHIAHPVRGACQTSAFSAAYGHPPVGKSGHVWRTDQERPDSPVIILPDISKLAGVVEAPGVTVGNLKGVEQAEFKLDPQTAVLDAATGDLIRREIDGRVIPQRRSDGYWNATAMCKAAGRLMGHYSENAATKQFMDELSSDIGIPISDLVLSNKGGMPDVKGTWVHPRVAIHLAQWCSPRFAVKVTEWVHELMTTGSVSLKPAIDFSDPVAVARLYIESEEGRRAAVQQVLQLEDRVEAVAEEAKDAHRDRALAVDYLRSPIDCVTCSKFFMQTRSVLGYTKATGFPYLVDAGILTKGHKRADGDFEYEPTANWSGKGYFHLRSAYYEKEEQIRPDSPKALVKVAVQTIYLTPDRLNGRGEVVEKRGYSWLYNYMITDERTTLSRMIQADRRNKVLRRLYGCLLHKVKKLDPMSYDEDIIQYMCNNESGTALWTAARYINKVACAVGQGPTLAAALHDLANDTPEDTVKALTTAKSHTRKPRELHKVR